MGSSVQGKHDQTLIFFNIIEKNHLIIKRKINKVKPPEQNFDFLVLYKLLDKCICKFSENLL